MARLNTSVTEVATAISSSQPQLSKMLRGRAHIDLEQFDSLCTYLDLDPQEVWREAKEDIGNAAPRGQRALGQSELARRLRVLVRDLARDDARLAYQLIVPGLSRANTALPPATWDQLLAGTTSLGPNALRVIAESFDVEPAYLTLDDQELVERVESEVAFRRTAEAAGVTRLAARGTLTPAAFRAITKLIEGQSVAEHESTRGQD